MRWFKMQHEFCLGETSSRTRILIVPARTRNLFCLLSENSPPWHPADPGCALRPRLRLAS